ncbi:MAG: DUF4835 family protein [Mucilaginibacter polytrichastri]|nr:DUF4835 family protein [Mucilaginibacter polytrichastri]
MKKLWSLILFCTPFFCEAQDLNARVQVLSPQIQATNKRVFDVLETSVRDFLNNRKWSADPLLPQERIDCNVVIRITNWDNSSAFTCEAQIQSSRPVFNSGYNSTLLNLSDKDFDFNYSEGQIIDYNDQNYQTNLGSLLAFYAYLIVGFDADTYKPNGGAPYFAKAQTVVNNAQAAGNKGWKASEGLRNRFWLSENVNNKTYASIHNFLYEYHRKGLDLMAENPQRTRKTVIGYFGDLQKIDRQKMGAMLPQVLFSAKADEWAKLIASAEPQDRVKALNVLRTVDPANTSKYESAAK